MTYPNFKILPRKLRLPNEGGLVFNFVFGKVIRAGIAHPFGLQYNEVAWSCAATLTDEYVDFASKMGIDRSKGILYYNIDDDLTKLPF